jgi:hypothetical protein
MTRNRTTIEYWRENDSWHATEPDADHDLVGRGDNPAEATAHYAELVDDAEYRQEVAA